MPKLTPRPKEVAPNPSVVDAPLVPFKWIQAYMAPIGELKLRRVMHHPSAPKPVVGGGERSKPLWSRVAVVEFFDQVARSGVWPEEREVA